MLITFSGRVHIQSFNNASTLIPSVKMTSDFVLAQPSPIYKQFCQPDFADEAWVSFGCDRIWNKQEMFIDLMLCFYSAQCRTFTGFHNYIYEIYI